MRKRSLIMFAFAFMFLFGMNAAPAQGQEDQPIIAKDSVQLTAFTFSVYRKNYDVWSWVPKIEYRVNGPITSGSQLYVEFTLPGTGPWVKFDCQTRETQKGFSWETECGGRQISEDKSSTYTGPVNFSIRMRNELAGGDQTLFTGKMKVAKVHSNEEGPKAVNKFVYYVDHDWNLPIGYLFYEPEKQWDRDDPRRWARPRFSFAFWTRGESSGFAEPHLFHGGKEVGKVFYNGAEVGKPSCDMTEVENNVNQSTTPDSPKFIWTRWKCTFYSVLPWDKTGDKTQGLFGRMYLFSENPGDYEIKIIYQAHLIRSFKFAVDAEGEACGQRHRHRQQTRQRSRHRAGASNRRPGRSVGPNGLEGGRLLRKSVEGF